MSFEDMIRQQEEEKQRFWAKQKADSDQRREEDQRRQEREKADRNRAQELLLNSPLPRAAQLLGRLSDLHVSRRFPDTCWDGKIYFDGDGRAKPRSGYLEVGPDERGSISASGGWSKSFTVHSMTEADAEKLLWDMHKHAKETARYVPKISRS